MPTTQMARHIRKLKDFERMVELYQRGALIEYHTISDAEGEERFHVGFRYDAMSDDDYFELRKLEEKYGIKEEANWRGDKRQRNVPRGTTR